MVAEPTTIAKKWTYSEVAALDDGKRYELYDGELVEMPGPTFDHQDILGNVYFLMKAFVREHDLGRLYVAPHDLYITETRYFQPDLSFVAKARFERDRVLNEDHTKMLVPPDLIVEILSDSTARNDRVKKFNAYAAFGVRYYWLIDPDERTLLAYVLDGSSYRVEAALGEEDTFAPSLFPGLQIRLAELFAV